MRNLLTLVLALVILLIPGCTDEGDSKTRVVYNI